MADFTNINGVDVKDEKARDDLQVLSDYVDTIIPIGRTETILWENTGTTNPDTITLSEAYTNFDEIILYDGGGYFGISSNIYVQSVLSQGRAIGIIEDLNRRVWYRITSPTTLSREDEETIVLQCIIGIKY